MIGSDIYIHGGGICVDGTREWQHYADIWKVSPMTKDIQKIEPVNGNLLRRRGHSAVSYQKRWILIFGGLIRQVGEDQPFLTNDLQIFDLQTFRLLSVIQRGNIPHPRRGHIASQYQDKMIVFGGDSRQFDHPRSIWELDLTPLCELIQSSESSPNPIELTWRSTSCYGDFIPAQLSLTAYSYTSSGIFIYGGTYLDYTTMDTATSSQLFFFDHRDYSFHIYAQQVFSETRFCATMVHLNDNTLIIYGGTNCNSQYVSTILLFQLNHFLGAPVELSRKRHSHEFIWNILPLPSEDAALPQARNGMILVPHPRQSYFPLSGTVTAASLSLSQPSIISSSSSSLQLSFLMFGGGVYPNEYFNDWWELDIVIPPKLLLTKFLFPSSSANQICTAPSLDVSSKFPHLALSHYRSPVLLPTLLISLSSSTLPSNHDDDHFSNCDPLFPVHIEILTSSCDYFQSLLSSQWNDLQSFKVYCYQPVGGNCEPITLSLPVVNICDVDFEIMRIILLEIYQHYFQKADSSMEPSIECYLKATHLNENFVFQLTQLIHYFNRFQMHPSQFNYERYLFQQLCPSSTLPPNLLSDFTFIWHLLVICQSCYMTLLPFLLGYYIKTTSKIAMQTLRSYSLGNQQEIFEVIERIKSSLSDPEVLLPLDLREELLNLIAEFEQKMQRNETTDIS